MKQKAALSLLATLVFAACSSSSSQVSSGPRGDFTEPNVEIRQVVGPAELGYPQGPIEVQYEFEIKNNASVPVTLRRVRVSTVNPIGGAYRLVARDYYMSKAIAPNTVEVVQVWARGYGFGRGPRDTEPVTLKGVAYFDTPTGYYNFPFMREMGQYPGSN